MTDLKQTMDAVAKLHESHGVRQRGGKLYTQVVHRMEAFRREHGTAFGVNTEILVDDGTRVVIKAIITNDNGHVIGSGMAEEIRGQGHVNTTSALENAETSSIGRALASLGLAGGEYASANEMDAVVRKTEAIKEIPRREVKSQESSAQTPKPQIKANSPEPLLKDLPDGIDLKSLSNEDKVNLTQFISELNTKSIPSALQHLYQKQPYKDWFQKIKSEENDVLGKYLKHKIEMKLQEISNG